MQLLVSEQFIDSIMHGTTVQDKTVVDCHGEINNL